MFTNIVLERVFSMSRYQKMSLISFQKQFSTEEACHNHLFSLKWSNGYCYEKCSHDAYFETKTWKTYAKQISTWKKPIFPTLRNHRLFYLCVFFAKKLFHIPICFSLSGFRTIYMFRIILFST